MDDDAVAAELTRAGYTGLFLSGDRSTAGAVWRDGADREALERIARGRAYGDLAAVLAAEVLAANGAALPPEQAAPVYARALGLMGDESGPPPLTGNEWGFMYHGRDHGGDAYGPLGARLLAAGSGAVAELEPLLDDEHRILYVGSQDATLGNRLGYRVKDAAAFYIGELVGRPVPFHDDPADRDAEIERLRATLGTA